MAEFLIYNKNHWMDALSKEQIEEYIKRYPNFQAKYDARYQRGDIVEVRKDGFYTSTLKGDLSRWSFRVVCVPGLPVDKSYTQDTKRKRRRYAISTTDGAVTTRTSINEVGLQDKELLVG